MQPDYPATKIVNQGKRIILGAVPAPGYSFNQWSGDLTDNENPVEVKVYHNMVITAHFLPCGQEIVSEDETLKVSIPEGAIPLDIWGDPITELNFIIDETPPAPPEKASFIGPVYRLEPDGATFGLPIGVIWNYDSSIPPGVSENTLVIAYYDEDGDEWVVLSSIADTEANQVTASAPAGYLLVFALLGYPPAKPAEFVLTSLSIHPEETDAGEMVFIIVTIDNTGELEGSHTVTIKVDGVIEKTKEVTLTGGTERAVVFTTSRQDAGTYFIDVDGLEGSFTVKEPPAPDTTAEVPATPEPPEASTTNWWLIAIILAAVAVAIGVPLARRRRRN